MRKSNGLLDLVLLLFVEKSDHGFIQFFRYLFVGGFAALTDIGTLFAATEFLHIHYLVSAALAFVVGTIVNYVLSILWIFRSSRDYKKEIPLFTLIGAGGLVLNELILWALVDHASIHYLVAKLVSVGVVLFWSFTLRRMLFKRLNQNAVAIKREKGSAGLIKHIDSLQIMKYLFAGTSAFATEYAVFFLLLNIAHAYLYVANSFSFICGLAVSFTLNRTWAFKRREFRLARRHQLGLYLGLALFNLLLINVIIGLLQAGGITPLLGKVISMGIIVVWNFFVFRTLIFAGKSTGSGK